MKHCIGQFQFQSGAVKRYSEANTEGETGGFQFQSGAVKSTFLEALIRL